MELFLSVLPARPVFSSDITRRQPSSEWNRGFQQKAYRTLSYAACKACRQVLDYSPGTYGQDL